MILTIARIYRQVNAKLAQPSDAKCFFYLFNNTEKMIFVNKYSNGLYAMLVGWLTIQVIRRKYFHFCHRMESCDKIMHLRSNIKSHY